MLSTFIKENIVTYQGNVDYDGLWKKIISELFEEFILFVAPDLFEEIDFSHKPDFLQQELYKKIIKEKKGRQVADQIVKVHMKTGEDKWILIHIEIQGSQDSNFPKRMFQYFYKIYDLYEKEIFALALLTDSPTTSHKNAYDYSFFGTKLSYEYNTFKISEQNEKVLEKSTNPFAMVVLAGKYCNDTKKDSEKRYVFKRKLIQIILVKAHTSEEQNQEYLSALTYFIDYLLQIPNDLSEKLKVDLMPIMKKEETNMNHIETFKSSPTIAGMFELARKEGMEEGIEIGGKETAKAIARNLMSEGMDSAKIAKLTGLSENEIKKLT